jgi:hypothetical protein
MIGYPSADSILGATSAVAILAGVIVAGTVGIFTSASLGVSIIIGVGAIDAVHVTVHNM